MSEYKKIFRKNNRNKISRENKRYYEDNKEAFAKRKEGYYEANKKRLDEYNRSYHHTLTNEEWLTILSEFDNKCAYCGINQSDHLKLNNENLHQEHLVPLSKGGGYTHNNIIPACRSCNSSKGNSDFFDWYPKNKHYDEERNEFILNFLGYSDKNRQQLSIF